MKEQVLGASDRAALQSLIPLAGALGAGTIFALFFGGRRHRTGLAVFEVFAIVSVLVAVGTTAYLSIALLHADEAITDRRLAQTASPLIVAAGYIPERQRSLQANEDGLFDVTDARLLG